MRRTYYSVIVLLLAGLVGLSGCGEAKKSRGTVNVRGGNRLGNAPIDSNGKVDLGNMAQGRLVGVLWGNNDQDFQMQMQSLVSASIPVNELGPVSGQPNANTGARIVGDVDAGTGLNALNGTAQIRGGQFLIGIWDEYAISGQLSEINIYFGSMTGNITKNGQSGSAQIQMQDSYGSVTLSGQFDMNQFTGTMNFTNNCTIPAGSQTCSESGSHSGAVQFRVPTCGFFRC